MRVDFCLPIKNEAPILESTLNKLLDYCRTAQFDFNWQIVGVVNGSSDSSVDILQDFQKRFPTEINYFEITEAGRGRALKKYWELSTADILSYMDCDLAVSLDKLPELIEPIINNEADLVIGSRLSNGAKVKRSLFREFVSQFYNLLSKLILNHQIDDLQCGFKAIKKEAFLRIREYLLDDFWFFDTELILLTSRFNFKIKQLPVDWQENRFGNRKSTVKIFYDSLAFIKNLFAFRQRLKKIKNIQPPR